MAPVIGGGLAAVGSIGGALIGSSGASTAGSQQAGADISAQQQADATQLQMFNKEQANLQPYINAGDTALPSLISGTAPGGQFNSQPTAAQIQSAMSPAFNFDLQQGNLSIQNSAAANGTLLSGGTLSALQSYGQGMASNEYANAYQRFMTTRQANYGNLAQLAGIGSGTNQTGAALTGSTSNSMAANTLAGISSAGAANAAGTVGSTNAITGGIGGLSSLASQYGTLSALNGSAGNYGGGGGGAITGNYSDSFAPIDQ